MPLIPLRQFQPLDSSCFQQSHSSVENAITYSPQIRFSYCPETHRTPSCSPAVFRSKQLCYSKCSNTHKLKWKWIGDLSLISATCSWYERNYGNFVYQKSYFQIKWVRPFSFVSPWAADSCSYYVEALISVCCSARRAYLKWLKLKAKLSASVDEQENGSRWEKIAQFYSCTKHTGSHSSEEKSVTYTSLWSTFSDFLRQPNSDHSSKE